MGSSWEKLLVILKHAKNILSLKYYNFYLHSTFASSFYIKRYYCRIKSKCKNSVKRQVFNIFRYIGSS